MRSGLLHVICGTPVAKLIDVRPSTAALVLGLTASLTACARPGNTPPGTPAATSRPATLWASLAPAQPELIASAQPALIGSAPGRVGLRPGAVCDGRVGRIPRPATTKPDLQLSAESDAAARSRRALEAANPPIPRRGPVQGDAAAIAESCVRTLRLELTLLTGGRGGRPGEPALLRTLTSQGLSGITVGNESAFAASTGTACVYGAFTAEGPELSIGPLAANGTCHP